MKNLNYGVDPEAMQSAVVEFDSGRRWYANNRIIGISPEGDITEGYDGGLPDNELTLEERQDLARHMMAAWLKFGRFESPPIPPIALQDIRSMKDVEVIFARVAEEISARLPIGTLKWVNIYNRALNPLKEIGCFVLRLGDER